MTSLGRTAVAAGVPRPDQRPSSRQRRHILTADGQRTVRLHARFLAGTAWVVLLDALYAVSGRQIGGSRPQACTTSGMFRLAAHDFGRGSVA